MVLAGAFAWSSLRKRRRAPLDRHARGGGLSSTTHGSSPAQSSKNLPRLVEAGAPSGAHRGQPWNRPVGAQAAGVPRHRRADSGTGASLMLSEADDGLPRVASGEFVGRGELGPILAASGSGGATPVRVDSATELVGRSRGNSSTELVACDAAPHSPSASPQPLRQSGRGLLGIARGPGSWTKVVAHHSREPSDGPPPGLRDYA